MKTAQLITNIICDDIRNETNGKFILIGVYVGNIIVAHELPATITFSWWLTLQPSRTGVIHCSFRIGSEEMPELSLGEGNINFPSLDETPFSIRFIKFNAEKETKCRLALKFDGEEWEDVASLGIKRL